MFYFKKWLENYGGSVGNVSGVDDEKPGEVIGAFPTYKDDLPITKKNPPPHVRLPKTNASPKKAFPKPVNLDNHSV